MRQLCQMGFNCPYFRISEEGDEICVYPYIRITENEESETFGFPDEGECPLLGWKSELYEMILAYQESEKVRETVTAESERIRKESEEEVKRLIDEICE